ncbi:MAG: helix-turn-helix transcriptional regulator [Acidobacteria bacterium]|nr:helix-turn-helix transcriptional regulator [Acidobacteriota bacterium]
MADTVVLTRAEYEELVAGRADLEDRLAAMEGDDGSRIPHEVALAIMRGEHPVIAYRKHRNVTLRELSERTGVAASYLSEIERGIKPGSTQALSRIATALGATIDTLVSLGRDE